MMVMVMVAIRILSVVNTFSFTILRLLESCHVVIKSSSFQVSACIKCYSRRQKESHSIEAKQEYNEENIKLKVSPNKKNIKKCASTQRQNQR